MLAQNSYEYVKIGLALRLLRNIASDHPAKSVIEVVDDLIKLLESANFTVSLAALTKSQQNAKLRADLKAVGDELVGDDLCTRVQTAFEMIEKVVFAEGLTKMIYVLPQRRFNTEFLLAKPEKLLKDGSFEKMDEIAKVDFASACRCILFGEATAAAFHVLRATESVLKTYYHHHRRQNRLSKPMWGSMTDQLRAKKRNKPPEALLTSLDLVRTQYRNPTNHPEATYQIDSAQDLFGVCLDLIGKMTQEL